MARSRGLEVDVGRPVDPCYPAGSFEVVAMIHFLEHVPEPQSVLEVLRVLMPGGTAVILTPNASSWMHRRVSRDWQSPEPPRHLQVFT